MNRELFRSTDLPVLQNRTFVSAAQARASTTGDVVLVQDSETGMVFNAAFDARLLRYDQEYQNEQACSTAFRRHLAQVADIIGRRGTGGRFVEIGCGKGYFLELLRSLGYDATGIDPAYEGESAAVLKQRFDPGMALQADVVILRHVLEHIPDPFEFLASVAESNGGTGQVYIEVPCFDWILQHSAWFDICYEHVNYFRQVDFERLFGRVVECGRVFGTQYLYVIADLASLRTPRSTPTDSVQMPAGFLAGVDWAASQLADVRHRRSAVRGAGSKGVIFSIYMQRAGMAIDLAVDINPAKQGRYLAVSGLEVCAPHEADARLADGDTVFVMNSNYLDEILETSARRYRYLTVDRD